MNALQVAIFLVVLVPFLAYFAALRSAFATLERKVDRLAAKLDLLLKANHIETDPTLSLSAGVRNAIAQGKKIEAIKLYRDESGLGLREAKEAIDRLMG
jgi:ribosomal protein L7/L12